MVLKLQKHSHSAYCCRKWACRFRYPKPPSDKPVIAKEPDNDNGNKLQVLSEAKYVISAVYKTLVDNNLPDNLSLEEFLAHAKVKTSDYYKPLSAAVRGRKLILP